MISNRIKWKYKRNSFFKSSSSLGTNYWTHLSIYFKRAGFIIMKEPN